MRIETKVVEWDGMDEAIKALYQGGIVAFPTETVYGLACLAIDASAAEQMYYIKGRDKAKPFTLMCANTAQVAQYCRLMGPDAAVLKAFTPGEITLLLRSRNNNPKCVDLGSGVTGVRIPAHETVRQLIERVGAPLLVTSANYSGSPALVHFEDVNRQFSGFASVIIKGECVSSTPSTVMDLVHLDQEGLPVMLRQGKVSAELVRDVYQLFSSTVSIGCDHGGFEYKEAIREYLEAGGYKVIDHGCFSKESVDYPQYGKAVGEDVASGKANCGVVICTSGIGISIAANKVRGVRCGIAYTDEVASKMREHNNANVIAFGEKYMELDHVLRRLDTFLSTGFSPEQKHRRRVSQIED